ncbi:putative sulfide-quinone reductase [Mycobacterium xenopi 3993]|nr:putative sulfide-quinone reductase [Mycobacterium xenopi 3993]
MVGVGHGTCTCDFGVGGMQFEDQGFLQSSPMWSESLFRERGVKAITQAAVHEVMDGKLRYEQLDGQERDLDFDFAMLLQPFRGANLTAYDKDGNDITSTLFAPSGFLKVDADYSGKPYDEWSAEDWPHTYESPAYPNIFAPGIAFAPPTRSANHARAPTGR